MSNASTGKTGPVGVGIIGAGVISKTYLENLTSFPDVQVLAVGDLVESAAQARAGEFGIDTHGGVDAVLGHPDVEIVVNLTIPVAHAEVAQKAIEAGKHVWNEKPLTLDRDSGQALIDAAEKAGVRIGCAPDTFLGTGLQTTQKIIERGDIGTPLTALTLMQSPGPESWHPNPAFLFQEGAGPLFDIGPYYLTALVQMLGPVATAYAVSSKSKAQRTIGSGPKAGEVFDVTVPTHHGATLSFESGASSQDIFSFESSVGRILFEINGTEGTIAVPDPNMFQGEIKVRKAGSDDWETVADTKELSSRGTGALDMARAIREDRPHRATGALALHVLDTMQSIAESAERGAPVEVKSTTDRPAAIPDDWDPKARTV
ncbi:putative dehydrogenase [Friedmanniella endophytica]|uniref:Putative dehydrogenase n=1 Tax=Microlunatus kandeliicorticis TaxID=1759536 RepID=A0A7W3IQR7_9ACTN|nr:Gfo/Idh/MocA family oxidoreductase [Microlunatus kandeliicorticis]MBA8793493.1 putative dehydrogenase [Microlunatus kandeliicorticis]